MFVLLVDGDRQRDRVDRVRRSVRAFRADAGRAVRARRRRVAAPSLVGSRYGAGPWFGANGGRLPRCGRRNGYASLPVCGSKRSGGRSPGAGDVVARPRRRSVAARSGTTSPRGSSPSPRRRSPAARRAAAAAARPTPRASPAPMLNGLPLQSTVVPASLSDVTAGSTPSGAVGQLRQRRQRVGRGRAVLQRVVDAPESPHAGEVVVRDVAVHQEVADALLAAAAAALVLDVERLGRPDALRVGALRRRRDAAADACRARVEAAGFGARLAAPADRRRRARGARGRPPSRRG